MINSIKNIKLTKNQLEAISAAKQFVRSDNDIFILTGAAGTGKTTVVKNIIDHVSSLISNIILLAPTNRAAKVLSKKTGMITETIHSEIYELEEIKNKDGNVISLKFIPKINKRTLSEDDTAELKKQNNLFIIDESSMISASPNKDGALISDNSLLQDLYNHVKIGTPKNKIIFVGDSYQLPPIGYNGVAPALQKVYLEQNFTKKITEFKLTNIFRQEKNSPILDVAQDIKNRIDSNQKTYNLSIPDRDGKYDSFIKNFSKVYDFKDSTKTIALGWSRKNVLQLNLDIRKNLFKGQPKVFEIGDRLYLNTTWEKFPIKIPKGEIGKVIEIKEYEGTIKGGLLFHDLTIEFTNIKEEKIQIQTKIFSDYTYADIDIIQKEMFIKLAMERSKENKKFKKYKDPKDDPYMNAMQVKFAYALTVHKAQGGEWENVFLHANTNWRDLRWNYTAVTRASKNIYSYLK